MLRVQILEGTSINITTYFKEQQTKFLGGANRFLGGAFAPPPLAPSEINPEMDPLFNTNSKLTTASLLLIHCECFKT